MNMFFELSFGITSEVLTNASGLRRVNLKLQTGEHSFFTVHRPTESEAHCAVSACFPCLYLGPDRELQEGEDGSILYMDIYPY